MTRIKNLIAIGAFSLLVLALPAIASAQYRDNDRYGNGNGNSNGGYNNGGYNNGGYNNGQYGDTRSTLRDLKNRAGDLERQIDRELDRSRLNGSRREDQINDLAHRFRSSVNNIDSSYNSRNDNDMRRTLDLASQLDRAMSRSGLSYGVKGNWSAIRNDLQQLGNGYGYNNNTRGNRNGGYGNGNNRPTRPSWWPF